MLEPLDGFFYQFGLHPLCTVNKSIFEVTFIDISIDSEVY